jgi:hypothetical protein
MSKDHSTLGKATRLLATFVAFVALMSSVLTAVVVGTASAASTAMTPVGAFVTNGGSGLTTASATLENAGDVLAIWVQATTASAAGHVTSITPSGAGVIGTALKALNYTTVQHGPPFNDDEIWYAPVTTAGAVTLTFAWSGSAAGSNIEYSTQEFQPSSAATYSIDTTNTLEVSSASTTINFPSITPAGANELYLGYNSNNTSGVYGVPTTSGYTPESGFTGDAIIFNGDAGSGAQSPTTTASGGPTVQSAIGAMIIATAATSSTVTFMPNGGTGTMPNQTESSPTALNANAFTYAGHTFTGWNTLANDTGTPYAPGATYPFTVSTDLYAQWTTATSYTVTFMANGGTGTMPNEVESAPTALTANAFTYAGHTFNDWNTLANGSGTPYANGATYPFTASTDLYAQWTVYVAPPPPPPPTLTTLSVTAGNISITVGGTVTPTASVTDGLKSPDTATVTATYSYAGTGSTTYAASATAPTAAGTYSITPSAATVTISPATDAANYSTTYDYYPGTLTITALVVPPPVVPTPHVIKVVGTAFVGGSRTITIEGRDFSAGPSVTSNESGATVRVHSRSATRIVLTVTVRAGSHVGVHLFTITTNTGKKCRIGYVTR